MTDREQTFGESVEVLQERMRREGRCPECGWRTGGSVCGACYRRLLAEARERERG